MSAKSTPHILSLNCEYTFLLLSLLIIGLRSSSANIEELGFAVAIPLPIRSKELDPAVDFFIKKFINHTR